MGCPACTSTRLTAIQIRLAPDEDHTFAPCQACEWKGWFKEGAGVPLGKLLVDRSRDDLTVRAVSEEGNA
jgi:hypothetical protein